MIDHQERGNTLNNEVDQQVMALIFLQAYKTWLSEPQTENAVQPSRPSRRRELLAAFGSGLMTLGQRMERRFGSRDIDTVQLGKAAGQ